MRKKSFPIVLAIICFVLLLPLWGLAEEDVQGVIQQTPGYWTQEKMDEAIANPADGKIEGTQQLIIEQEPSDPPILVPPNIKDKNSFNTLDLSAPFTLSLACPASGYSWSFDTNNTDYPERVIGKLFFTDSQGIAKVCSASLISADIIATAGHCVTSNKKWHTNILFVPGYKYDERPYGTFSVKAARVKTSWFNDANYGRDVAFAKLWTNLGDSIGWLGHWYNANPASLQWYQCGYPAADPFDGSIMAVNLAGYGGRHATIPQAIAIGSALTPGSSGGPWVLLREDGPYANSVTSFHLVSCPETKGGPYFDTDIYEMYERLRDSQ